MRQSLIRTLLLAALAWGGGDLVAPHGNGAAGAAFAKSGSDDDSGGNSGPGSDNSGSGSRNSGSGSSGSGSSGSGSSGSGSRANPEGAGGATIFGGDGIHIQFADGHSERIRDGRFERLDRRGRIVESHQARRTDVNRLRALGTAVRRSGIQSRVHNVIEIDEARGDVAITDYRGWREILSHGSYVLKDPNGRTVARRAVTPQDIRRIREMLKLE